MPKAMPKQDLKTALSLIAPDTMSLCMARSADEKRIGLKEIKAQFERDWSQIEDPSLEYNWTSISAAENVAWVAIDAVFKAKVDGQEPELPIQDHKSPRETGRQVADSPRAFFFS